ncbi:S41 family peptidase [Amorphoplanes digitatis]|uniref:C-terminal processing protease CtpA/Prc n=1 Tax=Actinoplanes digitatis TaxID=1868 RepID=A0A7W7HZL0_9ACTN|nr:S41 family peptidase [Actinoplanes digitatis]MBB4763601.1 C-terminal processing protease CtpA/Prc [Actinoplanes digitatis]GID93140.1 interphotoreceptor retinoid-binding protein [Actinoplanes digitatis]
MSPDVIDEALALLCAKYIFPEKAEAAAAAIRRRKQAGEYAGLDERHLTERLTAELFEICGDKHLRVRVREAELHAALTREEAAAAYLRQAPHTNYGIARVERLDGNIGYLDLRQIPEASAGGRAIAAAMELVSHTEALIIDLRKNRGGSPNGVTFWLSYLFPDDETHLNGIYQGESGETRQFWSLAYLPGERYLDRPVSVLTSEVTFSAGEEFCYNLQAYGRATLIGQTTRGGAHPTEFFPITPTVEITVPIARSISPVTGGNWEGTGVVPDIEVPAGEAFATAYRQALEHVLVSSAPASVQAEARAALDDPALAAAA